MEYLAKGLFYVQSKANELVVVFKEMMEVLPRPILINGILQFACTVFLIVLTWNRPMAPTEKAKRMLKKQAVSKINKYIQLNYLDPSDDEKKDGYVRVLKHLSREFFGDENTVKFTDEELDEFVDRKYINVLVEDFCNNLEIAEKKALAKIAKLNEIEEGKVESEIMRILHDELDDVYEMNDYEYLFDIIRNPYYRTAIARCMNAYLNK